MMIVRQFLSISFGLLTVVCGHLNNNPQIVISGSAIIPQTTDPFESWLSAGILYAFDGVLNNIGPDGAKATDASSGIVIASPSHSNPNYYYSWTRDAALTVKYLIESHASYDDPGLQRVIERYITSQAHLQTISNPSGGLSSGGLGEPKLKADGSAFHGPWGRPQRDGPALRATALITYANWLIDHGQSSTAYSTVWPIIQNDLSYVTEFWNSTTFDLWEEVHGSSFFTTAVQYQALVQGVSLAQKLGDSCPHCQTQAPQILCFLQSFWTGSSTLANFGSDRSGKDAGSLLGTIHTFNTNAGCDEYTFQPCSSRALANHKAVVDSFRSLYPINADIPPGQAVAIGRYPEDVYQGGHPWYLCTLAAAEQLYDALYQWERMGNLSITDTSLAFFRDLYPSAAAGTYFRGTDTFIAVTAAVKDYANGFLRIIQKYTPSTGALAEQFSRSDGSPLSALDLTWSYTALLSANTARQRALKSNLTNSLPFPHSSTIPPSLPQTCSPSSEKGPYVPVKNVTWPRPSCENPPRTVAVRFNIMAPTAFGEEIHLVGSIPELGEWDVREQAVKLNANAYSDVTPLWCTTVMLQSGVDFEFKFVRVNKDGEIRWEERMNRETQVPKECGVVNATINAVWRR